jgi:hypothetical protein
MFSELVRTLDGWEYRYDRFAASLPSRGSDGNQISKRWQEEFALLCRPRSTGVDDSNAIVTSYRLDRETSTRSCESHRARRSVDRPAARPAALSRANRNAISRPSPCDAPVIRIFLPASLLMRLNVGSENYSHKGHNGHEGGTRPFSLCRLQP